MGGGREAYQGLRRQAIREVSAQQRALHEVLSTAATDDRWACPQCSRLVKKVEGKEVMICGEDNQPGCGHHFSLKTAKNCRRKPALNRIPLALSRVGAIIGRGVRHLGTACDLCTTGGKYILGLRFRCVHCPNFSVCSRCEPKLADKHEEGHVFEIMAEDDIDWSQNGIAFPRSTRARIRQDHLGRMGNDVESNVDRKRRHGNNGIEGMIRGQKRGKYVLDLTGGGGIEYVAAKDLQPLFSQKQALVMIAKMAPP